MHNLVHLSHDELSTVFSFLPVPVFPTVASTCQQFNAVLLSNSFWHALSLNEMWYPTIDQSLTKTLEWKKIFRENCLLRLSSTEKFSALVLTNGNRTVHNPETTYFKPIRMHQPIRLTPNRKLIVTIRDFPVNKQYGTSIGVLAAPVLTEHIPDGFRSTMFRDDDNSSIPNTDKSAFYLGHYYTHNSTATFSMAPVAANYPDKFFNCGLFCNGYQSLNNTGLGYSNSWGKDAVVSMHVSLQDGGTITYFVDNQPVGVSVTGFYKNPELDYYVCFSLGSLFHFTMDAHYVPIEPQEKTVQ